jgi:hypothetical protein
MERRAESPDVGGRADRFREALRVALLGRHVGVGPQGPADPAHPLDAASDAEVDQAGWDAHDDVVGLDVQVDDLLAGQVVKGARDAQGEGQELLERQGAASLDQPPQRGALEVLKQEVWVLAIEHGIEGAHDHGVGESLQDGGLRSQLPERVSVVDLVRSQELGHADRMQPLVPDQVDLVQTPAPDRFQHGPARRDLGALAQQPGSPLGPAGAVVQGGRGGSDGAARVHDEEGLTT